MNRFYRVATEVLVRHDAIVDKLIGDEVMALFIPGICGKDYKRLAAKLRWRCSTRSVIGLEPNLDADRRRG